MKLRTLLLALTTASSCIAAAAAERLTITVSHTLDLARPSETITVPWSSVNDALPGAMLQKIVVKDKAGKVLPYQVTNVNPTAKDPQGKGVAYGDLIFQHSFKAGEKSATFTVEKSDKVSPVFPTKAFARYVPERLDDFAWENDKIGHRTYGQALGAPAAPGSGKEVLETSGLDIWFKRVDYPIVDRWYNKGHDHYHHDEGEGMDMYNVGKTRGAGGTGVWEGGKLYTARNYSGWKVIANGPVRAIFELSYDAYDVNGVKVTELRRFTVDAGHNLDQMDTTFTFTGPQQLTAAIGLNKAPTDKGTNPKVTVLETKADPSIGQWVTQEKNDNFGTAVILPGVADPVYAADDGNLLILAPVTSGQPLRYYVGAGWARAGEFKTQQDWQRYVAAEAARAKSPIKVTLGSSK